MNGFIQNFNQTIKNLFSRGGTFTPPSGNKLKWYRVRYEDVQSLVEAINRLSEHHPIGLRWRSQSNENIHRLFVGVVDYAIDTFTKMGQNMDFELEPVEQPEAASDLFTPSRLLFDENLLHVDLNEFEDENEALPIFADGWVFNQVLFAHDENGLSKNIPIPAPNSWMLWEPVLGCQRFPEWPKDLTIPDDIIWKQPEWVLGKSETDDMVGGNHIHVYGADARHWLAALAAARNKQGKTTLIIDGGNGDFLEHLYTESLSFDDVQKIDHQAQTRFGINPLLPVYSLGTVRDVEKTAAKWVEWFRAIDLPSSCEDLIRAAAQQDKVVSIQSLLEWLGEHLGDSYTSATQLKNFLLSLLDDQLNWLNSEDNIIQELTEAGTSVWLNCPYNNLRSRRAVYAAALQVAQSRPDLSVILVNVPETDIQLENHLVTYNNELGTKAETIVFTQSSDMDIVAASRLIMSGSEINGIDEYIRQLQPYEAIVTQKDGETNIVNVARVGW